MPLKNISASIIALAVVSLALLCSSGNVNAQSSTPPHRPTIGLALSGGSALGLTEVGVLQWFDEHHIPIDYIAGTSIGGLLGGSYATGMTPAEIKSTLRGIDWDATLGSGPLYSSLPLRRKQDLRDLQSNVVLGVDHGLELPTGVSSASDIELLLSRLSLPYSEISNFDEMPTPFRCVATDVKTGQSVIFHDGSLVTALRATMSIPGLFTPAERDNTVYIDGAVLDNIPTDAVKKMGADIVIAVDLSGSFAAKKNPRSLFDVLSRAAEISTYANERRSLQNADIVITPDVQNVAAFDFKAVDSIADRGYQAAESKKNILHTLALNDEDWSAYQAAKNSRKRETAPTPSFIQVSGVGGDDAAILTQELKQFANTPINATALDSVLSQIVADGRFGSFMYGETQSGGETGLKIYTSKSPIGTKTLRLALSINGSDLTNIDTTLAARLTTLNTRSPGTETRTDIRVGTDDDVSTQYYRPVGNGRPFIMPEIYYHNDSIGLFSNGDRIATYGVKRDGGSLDLGYNTGLDSQLMTGFQVENQNSSVVTGSRVLPSLRGTAVSAHVIYQYLGQDNPAIPDRGTDMTAQGHYYFYAPDTTKSFQTADINMSSFLPYNKSNSLFDSITVGSSFGSTVSPLEQYTVGGPLTLAAYAPQQFRGNDAASLTLGNMHTLSSLPGFIGTKLSFLAAYQVGGAFQRFGGGAYLNDVTLGLLGDTIIGPVIVGYGYGESGNQRVYFAIGDLF